VAGGHEVEIIDNDPEEAQGLADELGGSATAGDKGTVSGEMVFLALYFPSIAGAIEESGAELAGKVVVDIANPIDFETMDGLAIAPDTSSAEETAKLVPSGTPVVKAFNTTFARTLVAGEVAGQPLDVFIAGDEEGAKQKVARSSKTVGFDRPTSARCAAHVNSSSSSSSISRSRSRSGSATRARSNYSRSPAT
jgi:predicted dinucleotide-binding enzyme